MQDAILACHNVHKRFQEGDLSVNVLKNISLQVQRGEQVAIIGSSGSGKSTLLHLLGGLDNPSEGDISIGGELINRMGSARRSRWRNLYLGFIYQFHHLLPEFTALENVCMPLLLRGTRTSEARDRATSILTEVGLGQRLKHKPGELSGGERQRAAVARALVAEPLCILADEPTGNLDQRTAQQVYERMLDMNQRIGTSLILVTHDSALAQRTDRTLRLVDGQLETA